MEYNPKDNDVIHLLKKLKDSNGAYPPEMLALRRQGYLKQVAQFSGGAGLALALKNISGGGKGAAGLQSATGTIVEVLLVVALVAEVGAVAYFYRNELTELFRSAANSPKVQEVSNPPILPSPGPEIGLTPSPIVTVVGTVTGTETLTLTPVATPSLQIVAESSQSNGAGSVSGQSASTGVPNGNSGSPPVSTKEPNGNNGNHYGQTPKPERTKVNSSSTQESNNKKKP